MKKQDEYAEEYSKRERIRFAAIAAAILLPLIVLTQAWLFPALREFVDKSYCYQVMGVSGTALLLYGLFVGMPLLVAAVIGLLLALRGFRGLVSRCRPSQVAAV